MPKKRTGWAGTVTDHVPPTSVRHFVSCSCETMKAEGPDCFLQTGRVFICPHDQIIFHWGHCSSFSLFLDGGLRFFKCFCCTLLHGILQILTIGYKPIPTSAKWPKCRFGAFISVCFHLSSLFSLPRSGSSRGAVLVLTPYKVGKTKTTACTIGINTVIIPPKTAKTA